MNRTTELPLMHLIDHFQISLLNLCAASSVNVCVFFGYFQQLHTKFMFGEFVVTMLLHSASEIHSTHALTTHMHQIHSPL